MHAVHERPAANRMQSKVQAHFHWHSVEGILTPHARSRSCPTSLLGLILVRALGGGLCPRRHTRPDSTSGTNSKPTVRFQMNALVSSSRGYQYGIISVHDLPMDGLRSHYERIRSYEHKNPPNRACTPMTKQISPEVADSNSKSRNKPNSKPEQTLSSSRG